MDDPSNKDRIGKQDIYAAIIQLIIHADNISWNRFNNFLVGNSVLAVAWATIFGSSKPSFQANMILTVITLIGIYASKIWYGLGLNSRNYLDKYIKQGVRLEESEATEGVERNHLPVVLTRKMQIQTKTQCPTGTSYQVQTAMPCAFEILYIAMLIATWWREIST